MKKITKQITVALAVSLMLTGCRTDTPDTTELSMEYTTETTLPYTPPDSETTPGEFTPSVQPSGLDNYDSRIISLTEQMQDPTTIWRDSILDPNDPECLDSYYVFGNPFFSTEGKVYANDRVLAIDIPATDGSDEIYTFTFGKITGQYNQFLYLQPQCSVAAEDRPIGYYITTELDNGAIMNRSDLIECDLPTDHAGYGLDTCNYYIPMQAYDQLIPATYFSPVTPGTVWYTPTSIQSDFAIVNVRAVDLQKSSTIAMIRLYIAKDYSNETYYLHHAENRNLLQTESEAEVPLDIQQAALEKAHAYLRENDLLTISGPDNCSYMMEYLDGTAQRYYFDTVVPLYSKGTEKTVSSASLLYPVLAVTINEGVYGEGPNTLYIGVFGRNLYIIAHDLLYCHDSRLCLEQIPDERPYG